MLIVKFGGWFIINHRD